MPWSHGTHGILVSATLRIMPAKPFVKLQLTHCTNRDALCKTLEPLGSMRGRVSERLLEAEGRCGGEPRICGRPGLQPQFCSGCSVHFSGLC